MDSEFLSESDASDPEPSVLGCSSHIQSSDSDSDSSDDLQIDYLCRARPAGVLEEPMEIEQVMHNPNVTGYTLCGDNIDKNIRRRYQRSDRSTISLHYFHMYAVKNRIDVSHLSDARPVRILGTKAKAHSIIPSCDDDLQLKKNIAILVSRVLVNHMEFFKFCFSDVTFWHIKHKYYSEMSTRSLVVSA